MSALHLIYQHWFITVLLCMFGVAPVLAALGGLIRVTFRTGGSK